MPLRRSYVTLGCLAGLVLIGACGDLVGGPVSNPTVDRDDPCPDFYEDVADGMDAEDLSARYGVDADASVPGLGEISGVGCMSGSDTGIEAIVVHRRVDEDVYSDYIIADGGAALDWADWFATTQPDTEMRPIEPGWTSEPPGLSDGIPDQPVWEHLPDVLKKLER